MRRGLNPDSSTTARTRNRGFIPFGAGSDGLEDFGASWVMRTGRFLRTPALSRRSRVWLIRPAGGNQELGSLVLRTSPKSAVPEEILSVRQRTH